MTTDDRGRPSGDAYVEVESMDDVDAALKMNKRDMGSRWVGDVGDAIKTVKTNLFLITTVKKVRRKLKMG